MLDPYALRLRRRFDVMPAEALGEVAGDLGSGLPRFGRVLFVAGLVCFVPGVVVLVVHLIRVFRAGGMAWPLPKWLFLAQLWVVPFALWVAGRRVRAQRIRPVMLAHRRCPHCGYALRGLPTAPEDGATVCPECGCAWLLGEAAKGE